MELANIEKLIEKYENAETSLQEEQMLKEYFLQKDIPDHLFEYKALFHYFNDSSTEHFTKPITLKSKKAYWKWMSVAAVALLLIGIYSINIFDKPSDTERQEAEFALLETKKAFQLISQNLNKGENVAFAGLQEFEKAQNKIFKTNK